MNKRIFSTAALMVAFVSATALAGSPDFKAFDTTQFGTTTSSVAIKSGATTTNLSVSGTLNVAGTKVDVSGIYRTTGGSIYLGNASLGGPWDNVNLNFADSGGAASFFTRANNSSTLIGYFTNNGLVLPTGTFQGNGGGLTNLNVTNSILEMSAQSGNDARRDMMTATSSYFGQLGASLAGAGTPGSAELWLWAANITHTTGSNTWGIPIVLPGGLQAVGAQGIGGTYWVDNTNAGGNYADTTFVYQYGPYWSSTNASYDVPGNVNSVRQRYFNVVNGNGRSGGAAINVRSAFTNSIHGSFVGNDINGRPIYIPTWGWQMIVLSDDYQASNAGEAQLAGSEILLSSDANLLKGIGLNATRSGDSLHGIVPLFLIQTTNVSTPALPMYAGFPKQVANVYYPDNPLFKWALAVDENTGNVIATNGTTTLSNLTITNFGIIRINPRSGVDDTSTGLNVNTNASFNCDDSAVSIDAGSSHRLGFSKRNSNFPQIAYTSEFAIVKDSGTDIITDSKSGSGATFTKELTIDSSGNVTLANSLIGPGTIALTNKSATQPVTLVLTNATGGPMRVWIALDAEVTTAAAGTLAVQFTATNLSSGAYTWTPSSINTASTGYTPFSPQVFVLSNNTSLTYTATLTGSGHYNLNANVLRWQ